MQKTILPDLKITPFAGRLEKSGLTPLIARSVDILQINVGLKCNLSCRHCHLKAGPNRTETMSWPVMKRCLEIAASDTITTIDVIGGSPEMNPHMEDFLEQASALKKRLLIRSNLVILDTEPYSRFADIYVRNCVEIVGSLPDLRETRTDRQRGAGIFSREIAVLRELNRQGYGMEGRGLPLHLVHNPVGAFIPGSQESIGAEYRRRLSSEYGIRFNELFCITNNPAGRYLDFLISSGNYEDYMSALVASYNPCAANTVMCRTQLSVGWDGSLYDCDFNYALGMPVNHGAPGHIDGFDMEKLRCREIVTGNHCYACTAGAGSSCQGVTK